MPLLSRCTAVLSVTIALIGAHALSEFGGGYIWYAAVALGCYGCWASSKTEAL